MTEFEKIILEEFKGFKEELNSLKKEFKEELNSLKEGQQQLNNRLDSLETKVDCLNEQLDQHEAMNASRHLEFMNEIKDLRKDMTTVEVVTASNYADIVKLKAVR